MGDIIGRIKNIFKPGERQYTLSEAMKILKKDGYELHMPVPVEPRDLDTKYWIRKDESLTRNFHHVEINNDINEFPHVEIKKDIKKSPFQERRANMIGELKYDVSNSTKPGRVTRYNDYQSARNYQKKYGSTR